MPINTVNSIFTGLRFDRHNDRLDIYYSGERIGHFNEHGLSMLTAIEQAGVYNLANSGATGNGTTDDTTLVQATITSAGNAGGGTVIVPAGKTYIVENLSTFGMTGVVITGGGKLKLKSTATNKQIVTLYGDCQVDGVIFDTGGLADSLEVVIAGTSQGVQVRNCTFVTPRSGGVRINGAASDFAITGNLFDGDGYGVISQDASTFTRGVIANNVFIGTSVIGDAIELNCPDGGGTYVTIANNVISGYTSSNTNQGLGIGLAKVSKSTIVGNVIYDCREGIHLEDEIEYATVVGNVVDTCVRNGMTFLTRDGDDTLRYITCQGNTVRGCNTGAAGQGGISFEGAGVKSNLICTENICIDNTGRGIAAAVLVQSLLIANNICRGNSVGGIAVNGVTDGLIQGNRCNNSIDAAQGYGLVLSSVMADLWVYDNFLAGNTTGAIHENSLSGTYKYRSNDGTDETVTAAAPTLNLQGVSSLNSTSNAIGATLPDGNHIGQEKIIVMTNATNSSTVSVTNHETSDPEVFTFAQVGDTLRLMWQGTQWITVANSGVAT